MSNDTDTTQAPDVQFAIGDSVQYMSCSSRGSSMSFSTRYGKIAEMDETEALVKAKNGRKNWVKLSNLRHLHAKSPVNDVFNAIVGKQP